MLSPDRSSSARSVTSRLVSRRTLLIGGAVSLMAGCASDIRPLSEGTISLKKSNQKSTLTLTL